ncbi:hypothetical protein NliqN6_3070 [Naganishia liquefaciens]|uniref:peptidyl-tRNA hydrolase n=1 Tax=Naganishia liquefaciens TaxID=104408 RepID=A0A8H3TT76_9TREE|nr:hypothetical protein NliqN6_3070 [Naganishia liquefaciens]
MSTATPDGPTPTPSESPNPRVGALTMQIIIRRDLLDVEKWPIGPLIAQGSHAATAIMHLQRENQAMKDYTADWKHMRKAILQTPDEETIRSLSNALTNATPPIEHHLWIEEPENEPTALAILPNKREKRLKKILDAHRVELWK